MKIALKKAIAVRTNENKIQLGTKYVSQKIDYRSWVWQKSKLQNEQGQFFDQIFSDYLSN